MPATIQICMGSSCFSRGNKQNLKLIQQFLSDHNCGVTPELSGDLCGGRCCEGPLVTINGRLYTHVEPAGLEAVLRKMAEEGSF